MRKFVVLLLLTFLPSRVWAQEEKKYQPPAIKNIRIGFQTYEKDSDITAYKVGMWCPVYMEVFGGTDGIFPEPGHAPPYIEIETLDNEDVGTRIRVPIAVEPLQTRQFIGYIKTGHMSRQEDIPFTLHVRGRKFEPRTKDRYTSINIDAHLYLAIGSRITDFHRAIRKIGDQNEEKVQFNPNMMSSRFRNVVFETKVENLPEAWFGYNGVDLLLLSTENRGFLTALNNQPERLKAIAQWVRRGGRLVVPIARPNQDAVAAVLENQAAWQPPIPVVPPRAPLDIKLFSLPSVASWGKTQGKPFQRTGKNQELIPIPVATLDPGRVPPGDWFVEAKSEDGKPLIARVRYGLGQITYMAFSLEDTAFFAWEGKEQFLNTLADRLAPAAPDNANNLQNFNRGRGRFDDFPNDLTTQLLGDQGLDNFDVKTIPFGAVALFIVLYIIVVGPLDFVLLKYVFKRLEWTWITFPTVVLAVSVMAYFAAYALKGRDMKINKIDIVDFDLRTGWRGDKEDKGQPRDVHAYGTSFFTILSPRIQNYTIGLEPNPLFWGAPMAQVPVKGGNSDKVLSVDLLSWIGRPSGGMNDMGRGGSSGFFRKPYDYREDAAALEGVPIPVWTTKAFTASWEQTLAKSPFLVDLTYHQKLVRGLELKITGKLENHLAVDLVDTWLIYDKRCYQIEGGLKSVKDGGKAAEISIASTPVEDIHVWVNQLGVVDDQPRNFQPTPLVKKILFYENFNTRLEVPNHLLRALDLGWRTKYDEQLAPGDQRVREAILFGRVRFATGLAETVNADSHHPPPTKLWLGDTPETGKPRPSLSGQLNQDTYIRVILPVRPSEQ